MMTSAQLKAARALLEMDQKTLAQSSGVSLTTIRRMEASGGIVKSNVGTLNKIMEALDHHGVTLINNDTESLSGGRGVRLKSWND
jgi:predicted transcriptional regulator